MEKQELTAQYSQLHPDGEERQAEERDRGMETTSPHAGSDGREVASLQSQEERKHSISKLITRSRAAED